MYRVALCGTTFIANFLSLNSPDLIYAVSRMGLCLKNGSVLRSKCTG